MAAVSLSEVFCWVEESELTTTTTTKTASFPLVRQCLRVRPAQEVAFAGTGKKARRLGA